MKLKSYLVLTAVLAGAALSARAATETYIADPAHTSIGFSIRHLFTKVPGHFDQFNATIVVDRDHLENSSAEATIKIDSVNTGTARRDNHLKQPEFFDAAKFPEMKFKSTSWKKTGDNTFDVAGNLTIKGVTKPVVLKVTSLGFGPGMMPGTQVSGWEATTKINRQDFGVSAFKGPVGDDVDITINVEAGLKKS